MKAYKSLEAYNYCYNQHVQTVYHFATGLRWSMLKAKVNPSQNSADNPHEARVIIKSQIRSVRTGHCTCKAG